MTRTPPTLSVRDLRVSAGSGRQRREIVHGLDFDVFPGEALAIVGESGAGKSLAMQAILGLLPTTHFAVSGSADLRDAGDLLAMSRRELDAIRGNEIGFVSQDPAQALNPLMRVGAQIAESVRLHQRGLSRHQAREIARGLLAQVQVPDPAVRVRQYPHQFSGGMRQRAVIAMAVANGPRLVIADEPTTALDATVQTQVLRVLKKAREETGAALILITHDLGVVAEVADRVITLYAGSAVEVGDVTRTLVAPAHPYTRGLLSSIPVLNQESRRIQAIPGTPANPGRLPTGCAFEPRCGASQDRERCRRETPILEHLADGHVVACHFAFVPGSDRR